MKKAITSLAILAFLTLTGCTNNTETSTPTTSSTSSASSPSASATYASSFGGVEQTSDWTDFRASGYTEEEVIQASDMLKEFSSAAFANEELLTGTYSQTESLEKYLGKYLSPDLNSFLGSLDLSSTNSDVVRDVNSFSTILRGSESNNFFLSDREPVVLNFTELVSTSVAEPASLQMAFKVTASIPVRDNNVDDAGITAVHNIKAWLTQQEDGSWIITGYKGDWSQSPPVKTE